MAAASLRGRPLVPGLEVLVGGGGGDAVDADGVVDGGVARAAIRHRELLRRVVCKEKEDWAHEISFAYGLELTYRYLFLYYYYRKGS